MLAAMEELIERDADGEERLAGDGVTPSGGHPASGHPGGMGFPR
jgi:hypothetical protein